MNMRDNSASPGGDRAFVPSGSSLSSQSRPEASIPCAKKWPFPEKLFCAWIEMMPDLPAPLSAMVGEAAALIGHLRETLDALQPFANGVFNDNGDLTVRTIFSADEVERAYFSYRRSMWAIETALAACVSDRSGEASETRSGSTEGESAVGASSAETPNPHDD